MRLEIRFKHIMKLYQIVPWRFDYIDVLIKIILQAREEIGAEIVLDINSDNI